MVAEPLTLYPASQDTVIVSWNFGKVVEDTLPFIISGIGHVISVKKINIKNKVCNVIPVHVIIMLSFINFKH